MKKRLSLLTLALVLTLSIFGFLGFNTSNVKTASAYTDTTMDWNTETGVKRPLINGFANIQNCYPNDVVVTQPKNAGIVLNPDAFSYSTQYTNGSMCSYWNLENIPLLDGSVKTNADLVEINGRNLQFWMNDGGVSRLGLYGNQYLIFYFDMPDVLRMPQNSGNGVVVDTITLKTGFCIAHTKTDCWGSTPDFSYFCTAAVYYCLESDVTFKLVNSTWQIIDYPYGESYQFQYYGSNDLTENFVYSSFENKYTENNKDTSKHKYVEDVQLFSFRDDIELRTNRSYDNFFEGITYKLSLTDEGTILYNNFGTGATDERNYTFTINRLDGFNTINGVEYPQYTSLYQVHVMYRNFGTKTFPISYVCIGYKSLNTLSQEIWTQEIIHNLLDSKTDIGIRSDITNLNFYNDTSSFKNRHHKDMYDLMADYVDNTSEILEVTRFTPDCCFQLTESKNELNLSSIYGFENAGFLFDVIFPDLNNEFFMSFSYDIKDCYKDGYYKYYRGIARSPIVSLRNLARIHAKEGKLTTNSLGIWTSAEDMAIMQKVDSVINYFEDVRTVNVWYLEEVQGTPFSKEVLKRDVKVPFYSTSMSYHVLAKAVGKRDFRVFSNDAYTFEYDKGSNTFNAVYEPFIWIKGRTEDGNDIDCYAGTNVTFADYYKPFVDTGVISQEAYEQYYNANILSKYPQLMGTKREELYGYWGYIVLPETHSFNTAIVDLLNVDATYSGAVSNIHFTTDINYNQYRTLLNEFGYTFLERVWNTVFSAITEQSFKAENYIFYCDPNSSKAYINENAGKTFDDDDSVFVNEVENVAVNAGEGLKDILNDVKDGFKNTFSGVKGFFKLIVLFTVVLVVIFVISKIVIILKPLFVGKNKRR